MKEIVIDITDDGEVRIETKGFKGKACIEESQFLKNLLGKETYNRLTPAYYKSLLKSFSRSFVSPVQKSVFGFKTGSSSRSHPFSATFFTLSRLFLTL